MQNYYILFKNITLTNNINFQQKVLNDLNTTAELYKLRMNTLITNNVDYSTYKQICIYML